MSPTTATRTDSVDAHALWSTTEPWIGSAVGRYTLLREIGRGAMGVVHEAHDARLDRRVAIKLMRSAGGPVEDRRRLLREARAMASLSHPSVVPVYDLGTHGLVAYVVMELVTAPTLAAWLAQPHPQRVVLGALVSAGQGLTAAHAVGIVHRDFKPANVMIAADARARVTDFGLALGVTVEGLRESPFGGTPAYMAPEQHAGRIADARSDQYAYCMTAWEALFGARPFADAEVKDLAARKAAGAPAIPAKSPVPRAIAEALQRGLAPMPADRWPDMAALLRALAPRRRGRRLLPWWLVPACAGAAIVAPGPDPCTAVIERERDAWYGSERTELRASMTAVLGDGPTTEIVGDLDARIDAWTSAYAEVCRTAETDVRDGDPRLQCLGRARRDTAALGGALDRAPELARAALVELSSPSLCLDASHAGAPEAAFAAPEVAAIDAAISTGWMARFEGRDADAQLQLADAFARARAIGSHEQVAVAGARLASVQELRGDPIASLDTLRIAADAAIECHSDVALAQVYVEQLWTESELGRLDDAERTERALDALLARVEVPAELQATRWTNVASLRTMRGQFAAAETALAKAQSIWEHVAEDTPRRVMGLATTDHNLAVLAAIQGQHAIAVARLESERDRIAARFGDEHRKLATIWIDLALELHSLGRIDDSEAAARRGRAMVIALHGPRAADVARAERALSHIAYARDDLPGAIVHLEEAAAIRFAHGGPNDLAGWSDRVNVARVRLDLGDHTGAHALAQQAKVVLGDLTPPPMDTVVATLTAAEIAAATGHREVALADLEDTLELLARVEDRDAAYYTELLPVVAATYEALGEIERAQQIRGRADD